MRQKSQPSAAVNVARLAEAEDKRLECACLHVYCSQNLHDLKWDLGHNIGIESSAILASKIEVNEDLSRGLVGSAREK